MTFGTSTCELTFNPWMVNQYVSWGAIISIHLDSLIHPYRSYSLFVHVHRPALIARPNAMVCNMSVVCQGSIYAQDSWAVQPPRYSS